MYRLAWVTIDLHPRRQTIQFAGPLYKEEVGDGKRASGERDGANWAIIINPEKANTRLQFSGVIFNKSCWNGPSASVRC